MNAEKTLDIAINNPDFLGISGSRLYGTDIPTSDYDLRGFVLPPVEYLMGIKSFNSKELDGDHKIYSLKKYLELILEGDPQCTEILFTPETLIQKITPVGRAVIGMGIKYALSNKSFSRIMGYSNGEWRKAMAIKIVPEKKKKKEHEILNDFWNCYDWTDREDKVSILKIINKGRPQKVISSIAGLGKKRKKEVQENGYCTKSAAHSIRLVNQLTELMLTGKITFPRPESNILKKIRNGEIDKERVSEIYIKSREVAEKTREVSILAEKPDYSSVWEGYADIVFDYLKIAIV